MDLRGDLKTIANTIYGSASSSSDSSIDVQVSYGCQTVDPDTCSVCLEKNCNTMLLPCSHKFHANCIIQWTERQFSCPMCRTEISHFVPLRNMKSQQEAEFVKLWENHYMTQPQRPQVSPVTDKKAVDTASPAKTLKRTASMQSLKVTPKEPWECMSCKGSLKNEFVYFAFDKKFCSTPCRLKYARTTMPKKTTYEEGTTSFYVDFAQAMKYINAKRQTAIDVRELSTTSSLEDIDS